MTEYNGMPFEYNSATTNVNIDNQLAAILSQFGDDYIMDVVKDSINSRFRLYSTPMPNIVAAFEANFKQITDGYSSNTTDILAVRQRVYENIIDIICDYYGLVFNSSDDTDYYSVAYWLYEFLVSKFTENLKNFYALYLVKERNSICDALGLLQLRKENDASFMYSKKIFNDPKIAAIHCNIEYVISQIGVFDISMETILYCVYQFQPNLPGYISGLITDSTGMFFQMFYQNFILNSRDAADILTYIKLAIQQIGKDLMPE